MPWEPRSVMDVRREFVELALQPGANRRELCRRFKISPKTGYKMLRRFVAEGMAGLANRSPRPLRSPKQTGAATEAAVLAIRTEHPAWGGRKIAARLRALGFDNLPAPSTITAILDRHGMLGPGMRNGQDKFMRFEHERPNDLWQMDFKGHFALQAGRCHPLTVLDDHSRFNLSLSACGDQRGETVQNRLVPVFERYGLPETILVDNGSPWGNTAEHQWTPLGVWLARLGIRVVHSRPFHPQTLGKDERFHRTLNVELLQGQRFRDLTHSQAAFDRFRHIYNHERPHEALNYVTPAERYRVSAVRYSGTLPEVVYAAHEIIRRVSDGGRFSFQARTFRIPKAFRGFPVALRPATKPNCFDVVFMTTTIATIDMNIVNKDPQPVTHVSEQVSPMSPV